MVEIESRHPELHGHLAFATWLAVHAWLMGGIHQRADFLSWGWDCMASGRSSAVFDDLDAARIDWGDVIDPFESNQPP